MIPSPDKSLPLSFGRYQLLEELGAGGMARVYRAEMKGPGGFSKCVAVKRIHPHLVARNPRFVKLFISEARLGGYLSHPNILQTLDFGDIDDDLFIAMEFVDGPTLLQLLTACRKQQAFPPPEIALEIIRQATAGVGSAHQAQDSEGQPLNMVHRDLKPSNILLTRQGHVKVADFGVARAESNLLKTAMTGALRGTVNYMAPEQAWGRRDLDQRADLFSLAVLLFELLTLRRLYPGANPGQVLRLAQDGDYGDFGAFIPPMPARAEIIALLKRGLALERDDRFRDGQQMEQALEQICNALPRARVGPWIAEVMSGDNPRISGATQLAEGKSVSADLEELTLEPTHGRGIAPHTLDSEGSQDDPDSLAEEMATVVGMSSAEVLKPPATPAPAPAPDPPPRPRAAQLYKAPAPKAQMPSAFDPRPDPTPTPDPAAEDEDDDDPWADMATAMIAPSPAAAQAPAPPKAPPQAPAPAPSRPPRADPPPRRPPAPTPGPRAPDPALVTRIRPSDPPPGAGAATEDDDPLATRIRPSPKPAQGPTALVGDAPDHDADATLPLGFRFGPKGVEATPPSHTQPLGPTRKTFQPSEAPTQWLRRPDPSEPAGPTPGAIAEATEEDLAVELPQGKIPPRKNTWPLRTRIMVGAIGFILLLALYAQC